jgi:UDP-N-acetylmuramoyl-tripeptide--D-alanyl-D-alanine ligase
MTLLSPFTLLALGVAAVVAVPVAARWLRVAQREHYVPTWVSRMAWLWITREPPTAIAAAIAAGVIIVGAVSLSTPLAVLPIAILPLIGLIPFGLKPRGTSSKFVFTNRVKRLLGAWIVVHVVAAVALAALIGPAGPALALLISAPLTDLALAIMSPIERAGSKQFVDAARKRLDQVKPRVIAITGSYGKTSTKNYVAHLLSATYTTVASPASFNNRLGLARAVNDRLVPGTEIFVAEMGIFGAGEIRELSTHFPPDIAAITVIGEAHLQRMRSTDVIFAAKAEITERARTVVLPIDDERLAGLAERCRAAGKRVVTVSLEPGADADIVLDATGADAPGASGTSSIRIGRDGESTALAISSTGHAVNVAVAAGIAFAADVPVATIAERLRDLPGSQHRAEVQHAPSGAVVIDDTYNSNPVGAMRALDGASRLAAERGGPLIVVTPGMVELGPVQAERNRTFAEAMSAAGATLYAVGRTNRAALLAGFGSGAHAVASRAEAVSAAVEAAGDRGVILYENDLPDHYP